MRLLDLFCGRWGWSKAFAARGWECVGIDLMQPPEIPAGCEFVKLDVLKITVWNGIFNLTNDSYRKSIIPDFIVASSPCDEFACFGMPHFRTNPPFPHMGIKLFNHTRRLCEASGLPHVIENVKSAQIFAGTAVAHAGSFYLWGNAIPPLLPRVHKAKWYKREGKPGNFADELLLAKSERKARLATIPSELANCVAGYAERLLEQKRLTGTNG